MKTSSHILGFSCAIVLTGLAFTVEAQTAPTITCSSNLTVGTCADNGEQVSFNATATSLCGLVTVTCVPPSDSVFPLGSSTVTCRALDACMQAASCTFTVTVARSAGCAAVASATGGEAFAPRAGVEVTAEMLAELIRTDTPLAAPDGPEGGENEIEDEVRPGPAPQPGDLPPNGGGGFASAAAATQTPAPITSWKALGPGGGFPSDAQIAVSHTHVIVSGRAWMGYYNKAGTQLQTISARNFFKPLGLDDGSVDAINSYNDIRMIYDAYRQRFWIVATAKNASQTDATKARKIVTLGVSKTENPLDGWFLYWWDAAAHWGVANDVIYQAGDVADYPTIGIDPTLFHQTIGVQDINGDTRYQHVVFFSADQMAAGVSGGSVNGWQFWDLKNPDGTTLVQLIQAVVHHGATGRSYYVSRRDNNKLVVWSLTNPFTPQQQMSRVALTFSAAWQSPVDAPQSGSSKKIKMTNLKTHPMKAAYRGGQLVVVTHDARDWFSDGQALTSLRLIRLFVAGFPNIPTTGDPSFINRTFGKNSTIDDPSSAHVYYAWPAVEINKNHDMAIVYARSSSQFFPEVRVSAYFDSESDIRPSRLVKTGETSADISACDSNGNVTGPGTKDPIPWGDNGGASVDPKDDEAIWIAQQYARTAAACNGNYQIWVAKMFGKTYFDWNFKNFDITIGNFRSDSEMEVAGQLNNQGDGTANTNRLAIYLSQPGERDQLLTEVSLPTLRPGEDFPFHVRFTIPTGISPCEATIKAVINPDGIAPEDEYSQDNNVVVADIPSQLAISLVRTSGPYRLRVSGKEGCRYTLHGSPDLVRWVDLTTQMIVNGSYEFVDADPNFAHRFYRASKEP